MILCEIMEIVDWEVKVDELFVSVKEWLLVGVFIINIYKIYWSFILGMNALMVLTSWLIFTSKALILSSFSPISLRKYFMRVFCEGACVPVL